MPAEKKAVEKGPVAVENNVAGTLLHLGDGRVLAFGERAPVSRELAALLIARKQAK
jgi:hypothetical protein